MKPNSDAHLTAIAGNIYCFDILFWIKKHKNFSTYIFGWLVDELITAAPGIPSLQGDVATVGQRLEILARPMLDIDQTN